MNKQNNKTIWSIGATSRIAIEMQRMWAKKGCSFVLSARDLTYLEKIKKDLLCHGSRSVTIKDLNDQKVDGIMDIMLISIGSLSDQHLWETNKDYRHSQWYANTSLVIDWIEAGAKSIESTGRGHLAVITSVAADRAKKSNYGYGAAKAALDFYSHGIAHRLSHLGKRISILKPGPTRSPMTANVNNRKLANPKDVAKKLYEAIEKKKKIAYAPKKWEYIMGVIKQCPDVLWNKTNF